MIDIPYNVDEIIMIYEDTAICILRSEVRGVFTLALIRKDEHIEYLESRTKKRPLKNWIEELDMENSDKLLDIDDGLKILYERKRLHLDKQNLFQSALNCNSHNIGSL